MAAYKRLQQSSQSLMYVSSLNCMWENTEWGQASCQTVFVLREMQRKLPSPKPKLLSLTVKLISNLAGCWCLLLRNKGSKIYLKYRLLSTVKLSSELCYCSTSVGNLIFWCPKHPKQDQLKGQWFIGICMSDNIVSI